MICFRFAQDLLSLTSMKIASKLQLSLSQLVTAVLPRPVWVMLAVMLVCTHNAMATEDQDAAQLPQPLSYFDVELYQRLFTLQDNGRMKQAIRESVRLEDRLLMGHLLSKRYLHPTAWRSTYKQLSSWLNLYNDHPDASRIYWLAKRRRPANAKAPTPPKPDYLNGFGLISKNEYRPNIPAFSSGRASPRKTRQIAREVRRAIRRGWPTGALRVVNDEGNRRYLTKTEEGQLRQGAGYGRLGL